MGRLGFALKVCAMDVESPYCNHQEANQQTAHLTEESVIYSHIIRHFRIDRTWRYLDW